MFFFVSLLPVEIRSVWSDSNKTTAAVFIAGPDPCRALRGVPQAKDGAASRKVRLYVYQAAAVWSYQFSRRWVQRVIDGEP